MIRRPNVEIDHDDSALNTVLRQSNTIPATQSSIQALHKFTLQQHSVEECIICMEEFLVGSVLIRMPCSHVFHGDCIVKWNRNSNGKSSSFSSIDIQPNVSFKSLYQATGVFSPSNLIGSGSFGSVYKGILDEEERVVAVKWSRFKALVFEFMTNGSLERWLHPLEDSENQSTDFSLLQRLNIVIDVAYALHYLHNLCEQPIIHCDLKPSNVLDNDMIAHVSDYGLARILTITNDFSQNQTSTTGLKGSIGYSAPEYGMGGEASTQGDVYSYGILVLEMFSGRRPTDQIFKDGFSLHNFVKTALPETLMQIVDLTLLTREAETIVAIEEENYHNEIEATQETSYNENRSQMKANVHQCLLSILKIGLTCSMESLKEERI
uniref:non-specific serine/threonine protein kinase n=1 Tax=Fagus sylvatica TaxID=28930 RepID=A0A2N9IDF9_FAGSY